MAKVDFINYWKSNQVSFNSVHRITLNSLNKNNVLLPEDFKGLYRIIDGIVDTDHEEFLFYRWDDIVTMGKMFSLEKTHEFYNVAIFMDYMQSSWWYGVDMRKDGYEIGIIPSKDKFTVITNSLEAFIDLYIKDSEILYEY